MGKPRKKKTMGKSRKEKSSASPPQPVEEAVGKPRKEKSSVSPPKPLEEDVKKMSGNPSSSSGNEPAGKAPADGSEPDISDRDDSEREFTEAPEPEAGIFQGNDTALPSFTLAPNNYLVQSYSALYNYFHQSPLIFGAFLQRFSISRSVLECLYGRRWTNSRPVP